MTNEDKMACGECGILYSWDELTNDICPEGVKGFGSH
jgi:hypothetical protein